MRSLKLASLTLIAALGGAGFVVADDDEEKKKETRSEIKVEAIAIAGDDTNGKGTKADVEVKSFGKIVRVGPDGKVEVEEFGSDLNDERMKKLRLRLKEMLSNRNALLGLDDIDIEVNDGDIDISLKGKPDEDSSKRNKKAKKGDSKAGDDDDGETDDDETDEGKGTQNRKRMNRSLGRLLGLGEDGRFRMMDNLPEGINDILMEALPGGKADIRGNITVIGPDGKKKTIDFGDGNLGGGTKIEIDVNKDLQAEIEKAMKSFDLQLPKAQFQFNQRALQAAEEQFERAMNQAKPKDNGIGAKLDEILKRLDKLENELSLLKKSTEI